MVPTHNTGGRDGPGGTNEIHLPYHIRSKDTDRHGQGGPENSPGQKEPQDPPLCLDHHWASLGIPLAVLGNCLADGGKLCSQRSSSNWASL